MINNVLYFAYGSNMDFDRLDARLGWMGDIEVYGTHKLMGYKLIFNAESHFGMNNYANITKAEPTDFVEGVLYKVTDRQLSHLDRFEALYYRKHFLVDQDTLAVVYVCTDPHNIGQTFRPERDYLNICIQGAYDNRLLHTFSYLQELKSKINFKLHRRSKTFKNY